MTWPGIWYLASKRRCQRTDLRTRADWPCTTNAGPRGPLRATPSSARMPASCAVGDQRHNTSRKACPGSFFFRSFEALQAGARRAHSRARCWASRIAAQGPTCVPGTLTRMKNRWSGQLFWWLPPQATSFLHFHLQNPSWYFAHLRTPSRKNPRGLEVPAFLFKPIGE